MSANNAIRGLFVRAPSAEPVDLSGKTAIVTGASPSSLGFETARILASWGATVLITTRSNTENAAQEIRARLGSAEAGERIHAHTLDLTDRASVTELARWLLDVHGDRLDILVNNAGVHLDLLARWKEPRLSDDGFEIHWRTNYLGTAHLTWLLLPILQKTGRATGDARIVNVVSHLMHKGSNEDMFGRTRPYGSWAAYGNSKLALTHMTAELQRRYANQSQVQSYCLHPGSVFTKVANKGLEGVGWATKLRSAMAPVEAFFLKTPEQGAQTQIHCATHPALEGGRYFEACRPKDPGADAKDPEIALRLWTETETWIRGHATPPKP